MADNMGVNPFVPMNYDIQERARQLVFNYFMSDGVNRTLHKDFTLGEVFVVWYVKTLGNWKAVVSTSVSDGMYYEVTYDGVNKQTYLDVYAKVDHEVIPDV